MVREPERRLADDGLVFVLDIGTRSVVGIAGRKEGDIFVVEGWAMEPHPRRAMIDGQIEDIEQVARVAGAVKSRLEAQLDVTFYRVSVAAAGRALKTCRATAAMQLTPGVPITAQTAYSLENAAINSARAELDANQEDVPYYCAGHSVVRYLLDGYPFTTIIDHRATQAEVEIIATFLPAEVVESLRHCMAILELEIDTLTLEPIAAMRAVIPQDLRLLNLALVDVGAGTSDIALSADGTIAGYTMATIAGDEITETLIKKYLVDFETAERLKLAIDEAQPVPFVDILGHQHTAAPAEILETIAPAVESLAHVIAEKISEANGGPPAAVFVVGGGSHTPGLCAQLAEKLALPHDKVALAGTRFSGRLLNEGSGLDDPEFATPVGIALTAADNAEAEGASVTVNNKRVRLFASGGTGVMDALLMAGYRYSDLMGRNGRSLTFTLNGARTVVRGGMYTAAELEINGRQASLSTPVKSGDVVTLTPAVSGKDAEAFIENYAEGEKPLVVTLNGARLLAGLIARVNGTVVTPDTPIFEQDAVEIFLVRTVGQLCEAAEVPTADMSITVNGRPATADTRLADGDVIRCPAPNAADAAEEEEPSPAEKPAPATEAPPEAMPEAAPQPAAPRATPAHLAPPDAPADVPAPQAEDEANGTAAPLPENAPVKENATMAPAPATKAALVPPAPEKAPEATPAGVTDAPAAPAPADEEPLTPAALAPQPKAEGGAEPAPKAPVIDPRTPPPGASQPSEEQPQPAPQAATRSLRIELNGKTVVLPPKPGGAPHQLFDMLSLVDIDPSRPQGMVKVTVNGQDAPYLQELSSGDVVSIGWEEPAAR